MSQNSPASDVSDQVSRFHRSYTINPISNCWEWNLSLSDDGYGRCYFNSVNVRAHRLSYELKYGPFPRHLMVCHKCDNPKCVNPSHLFLGTIQENMKDKKDKGRSKGINRGEKNGSCKLTDDEINEIFTLLELGFTQTEIASLLNSTQSHVSRIKNGYRRK